MNDDEFFSQFPTPLRPEFAEALRARLAQIDDFDKGEILMDAEPFSMPSRPLHKSRPHSRTLPLVAALLLAGFVGIALMMSGNQVETALPLAPLGTPITPVISKDNAAHIHHVAQL